MISDNRDNNSDFIYIYLTLTFTLVCFNCLKVILDEYNDYSASGLVIDKYPHL